jgi:hypothetical protein
LLVPRLKYALLVVTPEVVMLDWKIPFIPLDAVPAISRPPSLANRGNAVEGTTVDRSKIHDVVNALDIHIRFVRDSSSSNSFERA